MRKQLSKEQRLSKATTRAESALSLFKNAAELLDAAADAAAQVADEAHTEAEALLALASGATLQATFNRSNAAKIRDFFGGDAA